MNVDLTELKRKIEMFSKPRPVRFKRPSLMIVIVFIFLLLTPLFRIDIFTSISALTGTQTKAVVISKHKFDVQKRTAYMATIEYPLPEREHNVIIEISKELYSAVNENSLIDIKYIPGLWGYAFAGLGKWFILVLLSSFTFLVFIVGFTFYRHRSLMFNGVPVLAEITDARIGFGGWDISVIYEWNGLKIIKKFTGCDMPDKNLLIIINEHKPNDAIVYDSSSEFIFYF